MSRKKFTIIIIAFILVIAGIFAYLYFGGARNAAPGGSNSVKNLFPFNVGGTTGSNSQPPNNNNQTPIPPVLPAPAEAPRLIQLTTRPVAGFAYVEKLRLKAVSIDTTSNTASASDTPPPVAGGTAVIPPVSKTTGKKTVAKKAAAAPAIPDNMEYAPSVRYVDQSSGNVYDLFTDTLAETRITNTTIPRVHEALFTNNGTNVILRYLDDNNQTIESYSAPIPNIASGATDPGTLKGTFLERGITEMTVSPDTTKIFYTVHYANGIAGILADGNGNLNQIFTSAFTGWLPTFSGTNTIGMLVKPSGYLPGYFYSLDATTGGLSKIMGNLNGLFAKLSPDNNFAVMSSTSGINSTLRLFEVKTHTYTDTGLKSLADKCVWSTKSTAVYCAVPNFEDTGAYPDDWYQGSMSFSDSMWRLDPTGTFSNTKMIDLSAIAGTQIDAINLTLDPSETRLFFMNKNDNTLWMYLL